MATVESISVSAYAVPTDARESDGTLEWDQTTLLLVEAIGDGKLGIGFTYADTSTANLSRQKLAHLVQGQDVMDVPNVWGSMVKATRNLGSAGNYLDDDLRRGCRAFSVGATPTAPPGSCRKRWL